MKSLLDRTMPQYVRVHSMYTKEGEIVRLFFVIHFINE